MVLFCNVILTYRSTLVRLLNKPKDRVVELKQGFCLYCVVFGVKSNR
jgi:hypothetical protein